MADIGAEDDDFTMHETDDLDQTEVGPAENDRPMPDPLLRRVKVYELRQGDWFDLGTGDCHGDTSSSLDSPLVYVLSEGNPGTMLLQTRIAAENDYNRQQETLIVWTDFNGVDMALSFQEATACSEIWEIICDVRLRAGLPPPATYENPAVEDTVTEEIERSNFSVGLPKPELHLLDNIEAQMRHITQTHQGRDALLKFVLAEKYVLKLVPLVELAEDTESELSLQRLSNIMKILILLNDSSLIEQMVDESVVMDVFGALEYDPEFPSHRANHRAYLMNKTRFKEVLEIREPAILNKIHMTWRVQYLKDVILARILDDSTFGVLNTLIFFNQVDIVQYFQKEPEYIQRLFALVHKPDVEPTKRRDAVRLIQQCCAVAKNLQNPTRQTLYSNFVGNGLIKLITFALKQKDAQTRLAGMEIMMNLLEQDAAMIRQIITPPSSVERTPVLETIIGVIKHESQSGVRGQAIEALKIILDPQLGNTDAVQQAMIKTFIDDFYNVRARSLFSSLLKLNSNIKRGMNFTMDETQLNMHLVDLLIFCIRSHSPRAVTFIAENQIMRGLLSLLKMRNKYLQLASVKFFRACLSTEEKMWYTQFEHHKLYDRLFELLAVLPMKESCLKSSVLDIFAFIYRDVGQLAQDIRLQLVQTHAQQLAYMVRRESMFPNYHAKHRAWLLGHDTEFRTVPANPVLETVESGLEQTPESTEQGPRLTGTSRFEHGITEMDSVEQDWFDSQEEEEPGLYDTEPITTYIRGKKSSATPARSLVDYGDDDDDENEPAVPTAEMATSKDSEEATNPLLNPASIPRSVSRLGHSTTDDANLLSQSDPPLTRLSEKRARSEEDDEDEDKLGKLTSAKRRLSTASAKSETSTQTSTESKMTNGTSNHGGGGGSNKAQGPVRLRIGKGTPTTSTSDQKISITLSSSKTAVSSGGNGAKDDAE